MTCALIRKESLRSEQIVLQVVGGDLVRVGEEAVEEGVLVRVEARRLSVVEVLHVLVVPQHSDRDLLEGAPLVDLQEVS